MSLKRANQGETSETSLAFNGPECERDERLGELCQRLRDMASEAEAIATDLERFCEPPQRPKVVGDPKVMEEANRRIEESLGKAAEKIRDSKPSQS